MEVYIAVLTGMLGLWLLLPPNSFAENGNLQAMADIATETVWGTILLFVGTMHFLAIYRGETKIRKAAAFALTTIWLFLTIGFARSQASSLMIPAAGIATVFSTLSYLRLAATANT